MKFKKIEISAFRIYDNPENAIFDFTSSTGEPAGLISLYAPNGFGKTSFYDAVEWGVTGSVNRFFIRNKELRKLEQNQISENKIPLLRNSSLERDTYVKITSDSNQNISRDIPKKSKKPDLPLKDEVEFHEFHKVILSQEWISAFLTEKDGEDKYRKFMETPELSDINSYYLNLKHLLTQQNKVEDDLKNEIKELEEKVKNLEDQNLLEVINERIKSINRLCCEEIFKSIKLETNDAEIVAFKDTLTTKGIYYKNEIQSVTEKIDDLRIALVGKGDLLSLKSFGDIRASLLKVISDIEEVKKVLEKYDNKEKIDNELKSLKESLSEIFTEKEKLGNALKKYSEFERIKSNIKAKEEELYKLKINLPEMKNEIDILESDEISKNEEFKSCLQQIKDNEEKKKNFPELLKNIENNKKSINEISKEIEKQTSKIEPLERKIVENKEKIQEIEQLQRQIKERKYSKKYLEEDIKLIELIDSLIENNNILEKEKSELKNVNEKIKEQQDLNATMQKFIEQGLSIVNEQQTSRCPLCEYQYSDIKTLAERISNNNALSDVLKEYNIKKQRLLETIKNIEKIVESGNEKLINYYTNKINDINFETISNSEEIDAIQNVIKENNDKLEEFKDKNIEIIAQMNDMTEDEYTQHLDELINNGNKSKEIITELLNTIRKNLIEKQEVLEKKNSEIVQIKNKIEELNNNVEYVAVLDYLRVKYLTEEINREVLEKLLKEYEEEIVTKNKEIKSKNEQLNLLNNELSEYNKENLKNKESELKNEKENSENKINRYILYFEEKFDYKMSNLSISEIKLFIENKKSTNNQMLEKYKLISDEINILEKNSEHISEFLKSENIKIQIKEKEKELSFQKTSVRKRIGKERKKTKKYIEKKVTNFFNQELIDKLYNKIDPHPEYKSVNFKLNLDLDNPRLDVFVGNKDSKLIIPNLYFSAAQINILSLCIFLSTALKSKEYDCIFIDDPIQSLDSINILSTIDLLRSLVVHNGKQIVISTHDENFHNLLKKKMPPEFFESKFLKLESFGKVINDG